MGRSGSLGRSKLRESPGFLRSFGQIGLAGTGDAPGNESDWKALSVVLGFGVQCWGWVSCLKDFQLGGIWLELSLKDHFS